MPALISNLDTGTEAFTTNRDAMLELLAEVRELEGRVRAYSARARPKFESRGQLLPREQLERLLDRGAPFIELSTLAGLGLHDDDGERNITGGGNIVGIGTVSGVRCLVSASDSGIKGGATAPMGLKKKLRSQDIALENKLPTFPWPRPPAPTCSTRPSCSLRAAAASTTSRACRRWGSRRSPWCTAPRPPAAPTSPACRTMSSSCASGRRSSSPGRPC